jgi:peptide/nickel transport system substrate-binding protein
LSKRLTLLRAKSRSAVGLSLNFDRPVFWPVGQILTRHARIVAVFIALTIAASAATGCRSQATPPAGSVARGGSLVASIRTEPRTFNRLAARDSSSELVATLTQSKLVRINEVTHDVEPWLAESWTVDDGGRRITLKLRPSAVFSDGQPFTAEDVLFTFQAVYDERSQSSLADTMRVLGKKIQVVAADPHTIVLTFPIAYAPGVRLLDNLPILPRHKLQAALEAGTFAGAWGLSTPPAELVGLGPFVMTAYLPGQRLVFDRNPRYWRKAADGSALPRLDRITVEILPDQNAELLRLEAGQIDVMNSEITPDAYASVKRAADQGKVKLFDLGVAHDPDSFWFNLKPGAFAGDPRAAWLQRDELRRAISMAVDRQLYADTVFFGAGDPVYGPVTPSNRKWYSADVPKTPYDPAGAKALLASIGLADRRNTGHLEDSHRQPVRFTLVAQKGRPRLERGASVVRDELQKIGLTMDVVLLDGNAVIERIISGTYDAVYFHPSATDTDPGTSPDFWFSSGTAHLWNVAQPTPATDWERRIDDLMTQQVSSPDDAERKRLFDEVQKIFAEHQPVLYFAAPRFFVAVSSRVANLTPAIYLSPVLWAPDTLSVIH